MAAHPHAKLSLIGNVLQLLMFNQFAIESVEIVNTKPLTLSNAMTETQ